MAPANLWNTRTAILTGLVITLLGAFYVYQAPTQLNFTQPKPTSGNGVLGLEFRLIQVSRSPPTLLVTLKNTSPDTPYTLLKWGTPLDPSAPNTGVFTIIDDASGKEVEQDVLQINRKMPPPQEDLVTVAPGTEEELEVVFDKPWMPDYKHAKYRIKAVGSFKGLWAKYGDEVTEKELYAYTESPLGGRRLTTNELVIEVQ
jgi:hypothetical protein